MENVVKVKKLFKDAIIPEMATGGAAGADLRACLYDEEAKEKVSKVVIQPGGSAKIHTGLAFEIPEGAVMLLMPRSSMGIKKNLVLMNTVGVLDSDYRGECLIFVKNVGNEPVEILNEERLVQALIIPYGKVSYEEVEELSTTERNKGGFGSTGRV